MKLKLDEEVGSAKRNCDEELQMRGSPAPSCDWND